MPKASAKKAIKVPIRWGAGTTAKRQRTPPRERGEQELRPDVGGVGADLGRVHDAGDRRDGSRRDQRATHDPVRGDAGQTRSVPVAADRHHPPAQRRLVEHEPHHHADDDHLDREVRDAEEGAVARLSPDPGDTPDDRALNYEGLDCSGCRHGRKSPPGTASGPPSTSPTSAGTRHSPAGKPRSCSSSSTSAGGRARAPILAWGVGTITCRCSPSGAPSAGCLT